MNVVTEVKLLLRCFPRVARVNCPAPRALLSMDNSVFLIIVGQQFYSNYLGALALRTKLSSGKQVVEARIISSGSSFKRFFTLFFECAN